MNHHLSAYITVFFFGSLHSSHSCSIFLLVPTNKHVACVFVFFSLFIYLTHCHPIATHLITVQRAHLYYNFWLSLLLSVCCGNRTLHLLTIVTILSLSLWLFSSPTHTLFSSSWFYFSKVIKRVFFAFWISILAHRKNKRKKELSKSFRGMAFFVFLSFFHSILLSSFHSFTFLQRILIALTYLIVSVVLDCTNHSFIHFLSHLWYFILLPFFRSVDVVVVLLHVILNKQEYQTLLHAVTYFCFGMNFYGFAIFEVVPVRLNHFIKLKMKNEDLTVMNNIIIHNHCENIDSK